MKDGNFLSQDIDILPEMITDEGQPEGDITDTDILPEVTTEEETTGGTDQTEESTPAPDSTDETTETTEVKPDEDLNALLDSILNTADETTEASKESSENIETAKESVEQLTTEAEAEGDTEEAKLLQEIYQDLLTTEANLKAEQTAKEVLMNKVIELQGSLTEIQANAAGYPSTDDPDLMQLNSTYSKAVDGDERSLNDVKQTIQTMYKNLFGQTIEEDQVDESIANLDGGVEINEATQLPPEPVQEEKEYDPNDITSILGM